MNIEGMIIYLMKVSGLQRTGGTVLNNESLGLVIDIGFCELPSCHNDIFILESYNSIMFDDVPRTNSIKFYINHPQSDLFLDNLGVENTFIFHRVMLSLYNSAFKLRNFSIINELDCEGEVSISAIESNVKKNSLPLFNYYSLDYANFLTYSETGRGINEINSDKNEIQELMWSMNMESILNTYDITFFDNLKPVKEFTLSDYHFTANKMLHNREMNMVMHTWGKLKDYGRPDFISIISNILEFIEKDVKRNPDSFIQLNHESMFESFELLKEYIDLIAKNPTRKFFFGIFNSAKLLGFMSRHGGQSLEHYKLLGQSHEELSFKDIISNMENKVLPNQEEIHYLFDYWHYVTSVIVTLWFRLKKTQ